MDQTLQRASTGDADLVEEWRTDHKSPNCGEQGWQCFGAVSEYDYLFVCVDTASPCYGHIRRIVNNCWEDESMTTSFDEFFHVLEDFAVDWVATCRHVSAAGEDLRELECDFIGFLNSQCGEVE